jgi:hypothetical protein
VQVSLLYFDGCPNWRETEQRLLAVLSGVDATLAYVRVETHEDAEWLSFRGSPTVLVDGRDPFGSPEDPVGLSCRVFRTPEGLRGAPTVSSAMRPCSALRPPGCGPRGRGRRG